MDIVIYGGHQQSGCSYTCVQDWISLLIIIEPSIELRLTTGGLGRLILAIKQAILEGFPESFTNRSGILIERPANGTGQKETSTLIVANPNQRRRKIWPCDFWTSAALKVLSSNATGRSLKLFMGTPPLLRSDEGIKKSDGQILSITMESGKTFSGKWVMDAPIEGVSYAIAGVSYTVAGSQWAV